MKIYFLTVILTLLMSCVDTNLKQASENIDDAKSKGIFRQEYKPLVNPIIDNDSIKMEVVSAWTEVGYYYDNKYGEKIRTNGDVYLRIKLKDPISHYYGVYWQIGRGYSEPIRLVGEFDMASTLKQYRSGDTLTYYVRKGRSTLTDSIYDTTQKVIFVPVLSNTK